MWETVFLNLYNSEKNFLLFHIWLRIWLDAVSQIQNNFSLNTEGFVLVYFITNFANSKSDTVFIVVNCFFSLAALRIVVSHFHLSYLVICDLFWHEHCFSLLSYKILSLFHFICFYFFYGIPLSRLLVLRADPLCCFFFCSLFFLL